MRFPSSVLSCVIAAAAASACSPSTDAPPDGSLGSADVALDATADAAVDAGIDPVDTRGDVDDLQYAFDLFNAQRILSGLPPAELDPTLSSACQRHVDYMIAVSRLVREEDPANAAYSAEGAAAAKEALLASGMAAPADAVAAWIAAPYHRLTALDPGVTRVGLAFGGGYACMDVFSAWVDPEDFIAIPWPGRDQTDVSTSFTPVQGVTPLPFDMPGPTGPIVSLLFAPKRLLGTDFVATIAPAGDATPVTALVRLPLEQDDPFAAYQRNAVLIVPLQPLEPGTRYDVVVEGTVDATVSTRTWSFTTAGTAPGSPDDDLMTITPGPGADATGGS